MSENLLFYILILFVFLVIVLILFITFLFMHQNNQIKHLLTEKQIDNLKANQDFKNNLNDDLLNFSKELREFTANRLNEIEQNVNFSIINNYDKTEKMMHDMNKRMVVIDETQKNLNNLSNDILSLQSILSDKKTRGIFGEVELYNLLENVYGENGQLFQKQYKLSNNLIADAVIFGPKDIGKIVVDSKFPLENYLRMNDNNLAKSEQELAAKNFKRDLKKHIDDIASKYLIPEETAEIAYMFIPAEAVFALIYGQHYDIIEYAYKKHVYIVSPTTLMAYLTAFKAINLGQRKDAKVKEIQIQYGKLAEEFARFKTRIDKFSDDFKKINEDIHGIEVTADKIIKRFEIIDRTEIIEGEDKK